MSNAPLSIQHGTRPVQATGDVQRVNMSSARSILLTLLGEFVFPARRPVWTSALVQVMANMGCAEKAARQAISRAAVSGWIESHKEGRRVSWTLTPRMEHFMAEGTQRVHSMSLAPARWDGRWLVLVLALPETHRSMRPKLYRSLGWVGFGNPSVGLWVNPHAGRVEEARRVIRDLGLEGMAHAFVGPSIDVGVSDHALVAQAWNLESIASHYDALLARFAGLRPRTAAEQLSAHIQLVHEWQQLPFVDPGLPLELLPAGWPGRRSAERLEELRAKWAAPAHACWRDIASEVPSP